MNIFETCLMQSLCHDHSFTQILKSCTVSISTDEFPVPPLLSARWPLEGSGALGDKGQSAANEIWMMFECGRHPWRGSGPYGSVPRPAVTVTFLNVAGWDEQFPRLWQVSWLLAIDSASCSHYSRFKAPLNLTGNNIWWQTVAVAVNRLRPATAESGNAPPYPSF